MGIHRMALGIEHGNPDFRWKVLRRRLENDDIVDRLSLLNEYDIKFSVNNIVGFPTETRDLALDTIRLNRRIQSDTRNIYTFTPFHGTPLRDMSVQLGYIDDDLIASSLVHPSILDMPQFSSRENRGLQRCFAPYVMLDESRWPQIKAAEALTPEGDSVWQALMEECRGIMAESALEAA